MKILVSAGPTREHLDPVRFLSNPSSGAMGIAVAQAALGRGWGVYLVLGPTHLEPPEGVELRRVVSTQQMYEAVWEVLEGEGVDAVVMAAAPCDFRPEVVLDQKRKKGEEVWEIRLVRTPDILESLGRWQRRPVLCGFALETEDVLGYARGKLRRKNLDMIVANTPSSFGSEEVSAHLLLADGREEEWRGVSKGELGVRILDLLEDLVRGR
ncbi:MAG: phosphopantothenoylcysteine decarboxylase [Planctomycetota bacterium]|nr:MAG: phosphopantothenoylcysteine decarboxylase [Planctomycetota bacterium]